MLNREAVNNRINALVGEYNSGERSDSLLDAMGEILNAIKHGNMRKLTYQELLECNGIPIWLQTTDKWLKVDEECEEITKWIVPNRYDGMRSVYRYDLPLNLNKNNYGKVWNCYERIL